MPGAWELEGPSVLVAVLSAKDFVPIKWAYAIRNLRLPGAHSMITLSGMTYDHARNSAVHSMLKGGFKWLLFIDDDTCVPPDTFERLASHNLDICSGLYYRRSQPIGHPVMLKEMQGPDGQVGTAFIDNFRPGDMVEADLVGAGCMLIHRRVFEQLAQPLEGRWFRWMMESSQANERCSEDFFFCRMARKAGFHIYVDTMVQCDHIGLANSNIKGYGPAEV